MDPLPQLPLLVFTDLDATLLDHDDYSFSAAAPALKQLRERGVPLVPTTSKTLAEMQILNRDLANHHPCIVENGSAICFPEDYAGAPPDGERTLGYQVLRLAPAYRQVLDVLVELRRDGFRFRGFNDMTDQQVAEDTGLSLDAAGRARQRVCSEPLLWEDEANRLDAFRNALAAHDLRLTRGGRYWHVTGSTDKARAMQQLADWYRQNGFTDFITLALGDSPNDTAMLLAADIAVVVRHKNGEHMTLDHPRRLLITEQAGPAGWNAALLQVLAELDASSPTRSQCC